MAVNKTTKRESIGENINIKLLLVIIKKKLNISILEQIFTQSNTLTKALKHKPPLKICKKIHDFVQH